MFSGFYCIISLLNLTLFSDAVSIPEVMQRRTKQENYKEYWVGNDLEGDGSYLFEDMYLIYLLTFLGIWTMYRPEEILES
jgi:hypothetical protein